MILVVNKLINWCFLQMLSAAGGTLGMYLGISLFSVLSTIIYCLCGKNPKQPFIASVANS
jgi:hypothetical protein